MVNTQSFNKTIVVLFVFLVTSFSYSFSTAQTYSPEPSFHEKKWAAFHPFIISRSYELTKIAHQKTNEIKQLNVLDKYLSGGTLDAFRHGLWMALLAREVGANAALALGRAHEKSNYKQFKKGVTEDGVLPDKESGEMDLFNNRIGAEIGSKNKGVSVDSLSSLIIQAIHEGRFVILKRNNDGLFVDCNSHVIETKKSWISNKCLVPSSFIH